MSRHSITIGTKIFKSKSEALAFYKNILGSYEFGDLLRPEDFNYLFDLKYANEITCEIELYKSEYSKEYDGEKLDDESLVQRIRSDIIYYHMEINDPLISISVERHPEFKGTKCFSFLHKSNGMNYFSYILAINGPTSDAKRFSRACRNIVSSRLREYKISRFSNKPVRCAITNRIVEWEECQVDHKAPLTFSVIVKSFIVANRIDVSSVAYAGDITVEAFLNQDLADKFNEFHQKMAVLRIISTKQNQKLSGQARIKPTNKDDVLA